MKEFWRIENEQFFNLLPSFGWKIHVSATIQNHLSIYQIVQKYCFKNNLVFKAPTELANITLLNSSSIARESFGKFITIYFIDNENFHRHYLKLEELCHGYSGPNIMSDSKRVNSSIVHYRFGSFINSTYFNIHDGVVEPDIFFLDNNYVKLKRLPYFHLPENITDPFRECKTQNKKADLILHSRYKPIKALHFSSKGGVYIALDLQTNTEVCIKECKPFVDEDLNGNDSRFWLKCEYLIMQDLYPFEICPRPLDYFEQGGHCFLVMELLKGQTLMRKSLNMSEPMQKDIKLNLSQQLEKLYFKLNNLKYDHHDFTPNNVFVTDSQRLLLIDFEHLVSKNYSHIKRGNTPGYYSSKNIDHYGYWMTQYTLWTGSLPFPESDQFEVNILNRNLMFERVKLAKCPKVMMNHFYQLLKDKQVLHKIKFKKSKTIYQLKEFINENIDDHSDRMITTDDFGQRTSSFCIQHGFSALLLTDILNKKSRKEIFLNRIKNFKGDHSLGLFFGMTGAYISILKELNNSEFAELLLLLIHKIEDDLSTLINLDFFHGYAGILHALVQIYKQNKSEKYKSEIFQLIVKIEKIILSKSSIKNETCWENDMIPNSSFSKYAGYGFAHGDAGIIYSLIESYSITKNTEIENLAEFVLIRLQEKMIEIQGMSFISFSPKDKSIWTHFCNGSAGVLLAYSLFRTVFQNEKYVGIERKLILSIVYRLELKSISFCHGLSGDLFIIKNIKSRFHTNSIESELKYAINLLESEILRRVSLNGKFIHFNRNIDLANGYLGVYLALNSKRNDFNILF